MCGARGSRTVAAPGLQGGTRWQPTPGRRRHRPTPTSRRATARCGRPATTRRWSRRSCSRSARGSSRRAASAPGMRVLDVAAGTGNASIPAAQRGAQRDRERPHARAARGRARARAEAAGVELDWVEADAEHLPFEDASFDVVMSSIGVMFAPHHQAAADELVRVCRPGGTIGAAELDARGHARRAVPHDGPVRAAAARPAPSRRRCGAARSTCASCSATASSWRTLRARRARGHRVRAPARLRRALQGALRPDDRASRANAARNGREDEFDAALRRASATSGTSAPTDRARFEMEYLLAVGTRA